MKRPIALLVGAVVAAGMAVGPAPTVLADSTTITGDNWNMSLWIPTSRGASSSLRTSSPAGT